MEVRNEDGTDWTQFSSQSIIALMEWIGGDGHSVIGAGNFQGVDDLWKQGGIVQVQPEEREGYDL